nr:C5 protein [Watermelon chlorotic stunt virus]
MILILRRLLVVVDHMIVHTIEAFYQRLLLHTRGATDHGGMKLSHNLKTIAKIVLNCRSAGLVVEHIKNLSEVHRTGPIRTTITNKKEHDLIRMILFFYVLIHPDLAKDVYRLHTKSFSDTMSDSTPPSNITHTPDDTGVLNVVSLFVRLNFAWAFTALRDIWASIHPVHPGLSIHGPVGPLSTLACDEDSGGKSTAHVGAVEVQFSTNLRNGSGNENISCSLRHNHGPVGQESDRGSVRGPKYWARRSIQRPAST